MDYDVLTQRFVHEGGTKEYQLTSIRDGKHGQAYTIMRWGKVGALRGHKVIRDDTRSGFHDEGRNREKRGYRSVVDHRSSLLGKWSSGNWTMSEPEVQTTFSADWNLMLAKIGRGPSPEELQDVSVEDIARFEHPDERAKRIAKPAKPALPLETTTENNPMFGAF